ncbi:MAG: hypothetical protein H0W44_10690 [Gammaproteobacteria bacterium]|nr:hypothetical protein [Gammaproteobacteria bacterium]
MFINKKHILIFAALCMASFVGCTGEIRNSGEIFGFKIGMSKMEVLNLLRTNKDISHVSPALEDRVYVASDMFFKEKKLEKLLEKKEISLLSKRSTSKTIVVFDESLVSDVFILNSYRAKNEESDFAIKKSMSKSEVKKVILKAFANDELTSVGIYLADTRPRKLVDILDDEFYERDHWKVGFNSRHAVIEFHFLNDKLERINYSWSPVELP